MKIIFSVLKKELICQLRDKRTLISMAVSILAIPLLLFGIFKIQSSFAAKENNKELKIAFIGNTPSFIKAKFNANHFKIKEHFDLVSGLDAIHKDSLDALIEVPALFSEHIDSLKTGIITLYHKSESPVVYRKISKLIDSVKTELLNERLVKLNLDKKVLQPIAINGIDLTTNQEKFGQLLGGFLPYVFVIICFMGCMYPSIDLITGEKEKGTVETLLTTPASRLHILTGKIICISLMGLFLATLAISGILVGINFIPEMPKDISQTLDQILSFKFIAMLFAMLIPLSLFFAGMLTALVVKAKTFKEAQSLATPVNMLVIFPAAMALLPGIELNWTTAFIPVLNLALATKEIIADTIEMQYYFAILASLIIFAAVALFYSFKQYSKESMIL